MGGEACPFANPVDNPSPDKPEWLNYAVDQMKRMHWTYLHGDYGTEVLEKLGKAPAPASTVDQGTEGWREIVRNLGYRFIAPSVSFTNTVAKGGLLNFSAQFKNVGFAALYNQRPIYVVLHNALQAYKFQLKVDPRRWEPDQLVPVSASIPIPTTAVAGRYTISVWMPDAALGLQKRPEYSVRFAHADAYWDGGHGYNMIKVLGVEITP